MNFSRIRHYGGSVDYNIDGFIEKNSDRIPKHLSSSLFQSKLSIVQNLFPEGELRFEKINLKNNFILPGNPKRASKKPTNTSSILRSSLQNLLTQIESRKCHYIFCIKSNDKLLPKVFEIPIVQHQVRYMR